MPSVIARDLSKKFRRRLIPAPPTLKERAVRLVTGRSGGGEEEFWALAGVSFEVAAGEMLGIIGANGSGKSTLLKLLAGLYRPDGGSLECRGRVTSLIELGAGFHPDLTGRENILINGLLLGLTRRQVRERFDDIVRFAGLEKFIDSPIRGYSSGMHMRLGFAIAAHAEPEILLIDEILAVGDEAFQHRCLAKIAEFRRAGGTIVYVSHDLGSVRRYCDRALWLDGGKVRCLGEPNEVIGGYLEMVEEGEAARLMAAHHRLRIDPMASGGKRWGSREVSIGGVRIEDDGGRERYLFRTGEAMTVRLTWEAGSPLEDVVFGLAFRREDGLLCYGTNTLIDGAAPVVSGGRGEVSFIVENLSLLEGSYRLDVAAHRRDGYPYDYHSRAYGLEVRSAVKEDGCCRITHRWDFGTPERAPGGPGEE